MDTKFVEVERVEHGDTMFIPEEVQQKYPNKFKLILEIAEVVKEEAEEFVDEVVDDAIDAVVETVEEIAKTVKAKRTRSK